MPYGDCYFWNPLILWLHVISDSAITLSCYCISTALIYLLRHRRDLPFHGVFWLCSVFIGGCGAAHLMDVWTVWHNSYLLSGVVRAIAAGASLVTAVALIPLLPEAIALPSAGAVQAANYELKLQVIERERAEKRLTETLAAREKTLAELADHQSAIEDLQLAQAALQKSVAEREQAIRELSDQKFALDQHAIVATTDVHGTITYVNEKFCAISGYSRDELLGRNHRLLNSGYHSKGFFAHMYRRIANGQVWRGEICNRAKNGSVYWVGTTVVPLVGVDGKPRKYMAIRADISARKQTEEARRWLAAVVESSDDAIISKTLNGTITAWNRGAERVFGYTSAEAVGKPMLLLIPAERAKEEPDILGRIARGESVEHFETERVRKDGRRIDVSVTISPIRDSSGKIVGASKIARDISERKRADRILRESLAERERVLKELADQSFALDQHAIVAKTDVQGTITYVNDKFCAISKYSRDELLGKNHRILNSRHHSKQFVQHMYQTIANGKVWRDEVKNRAKDGSTYWVDTTIVPFLGPDGKPRQYVAIRADITERKEAQDALREQAKVLNLGQLMVRDLKGCILLWTEGSEKLYGYSKQEAVGRMSHEMLQTRFSSPLPTIERDLERLGSWEGELNHRRRDGSWVAVASVWMLHRDADGRPLRILESNADITAWKRAEERLALQAQELSRQAAELASSRKALESQTLLLRSVLDSMTEGLVAADKDGQFLLWNPAAAKIVGMGAADIPSTEWSRHYGVFLPDAVTPLPHAANPLARAIGGEACSAVMFVRNPEQEQGVWLEASASPLKEKNGMACGGVIAFRDITQRRKDEERIRTLNDGLEQRVKQRTTQLADANEQLESFTYSVSHDLLAPLRHISGFARILVEDFGPLLPLDAQSHLRRVQDGTVKMGILLEAMLNLARTGRQALRLRTTNLNGIIDEVIAILSPQGGTREIQWKIGKLPAVDCDPVLIKQVFQNLIANSLKFSRTSERALIEIGHIADREEVSFFIRDNGVGFSMKYADKLFGTFQRLHREQDFEGTGIGLATVQRIIQKHGGRVWAESEIGKGATFHFTLHAQQPSGEEMQANTVGA